MGIRRGTTTGGYANAGHAYTAGPSSITFSFFFTLSASFSYSYWCPHRAGHGKNKAVCSHRASPRSPGEYSTPPALLSHSANKPHARMLFELSPTVATHLSVSSGSRCLFFWLSFLYTHRYYTWHLFMAWQNCCSNSPAPLALVMPPWQGNYSMLYLDKQTPKKQSAKSKCMLCVTLIGIGGQNPTAIP